MKYSLCIILIEQDKGLMKSGKYNFKQYSGKKEQN